MNEIIPPQSVRPGKDLEINLGGSDSDRPTDPRAQQLKSWANIIATSAALITAFAAILRPQDQTVNKNTYEQMRMELEKTNLNVQQNHDDIMMIHNDEIANHNYLTGFFAGNNAFSLPPMTKSQVAQMIQHQDAGVPNMKKIQLQEFSVPASAPTPAIHEQSPPAPLPSFDELVNKK
jgi:hypothetical protein